MIEYIALWIIAIVLCFAYYDNDKFNSLKKKIEELLIQLKIVIGNCRSYQIAFNNAQNRLNQKQRELNKFVEISSMFVTTQSEESKLELSKLIDDYNKQRL
jgi:hypothetical protein